MRTLRVAIDCRIDDPRQGTGTAVLALAHGLSKLDRNQKYTFIVFEDLVDWLRPYVSGPCSIKGMPRAPRSTLRKFASKQRALRFLWGKINRSVGASDGWIESQGFDVVHFPTQAAYLTRVPSIYQPWDLQHLHYPEFFSSADIASRELRYRAFCAQARSVCVQTEWGKQDLIAKYGVSPEKVRIILWGSAFEAYPEADPDEIEKAVQELALPSEFMIYPAVTWPHKNHAVILRALARLKEQGARPPTILFTGAATDFQRTLQTLAASLGVASEVRFLGFVTTSQLQVLFRLARAMIFPSKFEGLGLPVLEAFRAELPVISSNATVLPEVAGDAALYFDPDAPEQLAEAIEMLKGSEALRKDLIRRGQTLLQKYSADRAAEQFASLYKLVADVDARENSL